MPLTEDQRKEVDDRAELQIHRYMEHLYEQHIPRIISAALNAHNSDVDAHKGALKRSERLIWILMGASAAGGAGLAKLLSFF
jgi:hypothetical protein